MLIFIQNKIYYMEIDEIKKLRSQIREMLLNADGITDSTLTKKSGFEDLKKEAYDKLVDLKNQFEAKKENPNKQETIEQIDSLIVSLKKLKTNLGNQL